MYYDIPCLCRNPRNLVFKRKVKKRKKKKKRGERRYEKIKIKHKWKYKRVLHPCQLMYLNVTQKNRSIGQSFIMMKAEWEYANQKKKRKKNIKTTYIDVRIINIIYLNSSLHDAFVQSSRQFAYIHEMQQKIAPIYDNGTIVGGEQGGREGSERTN